MFRFSIRELMLLTLVIGLVLGWQVDHLYQTKCWKQHQMVHEITEQQLDDLVSRLGVFSDELEVTRDSGGWVSVNKRRPISKTRAIAIVQEVVVKEFPNLVYDCKAVETHDGYTVHVTFDHEQARLIGFSPGSQLAYYLSKSGTVKSLEYQPFAQTADVLGK